MNDRHNRIAGCQAAVDAARLQCDIAGRRLADAIIEFQDNGGLALSSNVELASKDYRAKQESYAENLEYLADALRR